MKKIFLLLVTTLALLTPELFSAGTPAGTVIQSRSRVIFTSRSGAVADTAYSVVVTITVAQKAAMNITPSFNAAMTNSDSLSVDYAATLINSGNAVDGASLTASSSKGFGVQVYRDSNGDGLLQSGERSLGTIAQVTSIPVDAQIPLIVRVLVPRGENLNGSKDTTKIKARSKFDTSSVNTGLTVTTVRTAGFDAVNPGLSVDNAAPRAGDQIIYSFILTNSGSISANNVSIYDLIPSRLSLVSGSTTMGSFNSSTNPVLWTIGTLTPGQSVTITLTVRVNNNVSTGTVIPNSFGITYSAGANNYVVGTNTVTVTVSGTQEYGVEVTPYSSSQTKDAVDTVWYRYKLRNSGTLKELIELSSVTTQNLLWKLYRDGNNNGSWDNADPLLFNTNDSAGVNIDSLAAGDSVRVFAMAVIPFFDAGIVVDTLTITAASSGDHSKRDVRSVVTTARSPVVRIDKTILPAGNLPAGSVVTYKITYSNTGSIAVSNFSVSDTAPKQTDYLRNSVKVNGLSIADNGSSVTITTDENNNTVITVAVGALTAGSTGTVEFKVKIQ